MARLSDITKEDILNQYHLGISQYQLAKDFEVSTATINKLVKGLTPKLKDKVKEEIAIKSALAIESESLVKGYKQESFNYYTDRIRTCKAKFQASKSS